MDHPESERRNMRRHFLLGLVTWLSLVTAAAWAAGPTVDTTARNAVVIDFNTGATILDKGADERIPPASMSKLMTAYVAFDYLKKGHASLDDMMPVSEKAWRTGGSKMFVPLGGRVKFDDLLSGMIIQSGNDACVVIAEALAGSEQAYVEQMNQMAKKLGLDGTHFANVDGLPNPDEYTTPRDLANLAMHLIRDFPEDLHYEQTKDFTFNGIKQGNRNPLLYKNIGVDGMKTGHTEEAGYGIVVTAIRESRRVVFVLSGMSTMKERSSESEKVLEWAYREFNDYRLVKAGDTVDDAQVWLGANARVPVTTAADVLVTIPRRSRSAMKVTAVYDGQIKAPVSKGQPVGKLVIAAPDINNAEFPLVAVDEVGRMNPFARAATAAGYLLWGRR
jgi:D-alanyl-D-alanine carboxypeptidase (penicillin-binding protein 5/6)